MPRKRRKRGTESSVASWRGCLSCGARWGAIFLSARACVCGGGCRYVDDLVDGLVKLMNGNYDQPVNLGNPDEYTIKEFAHKIHRMTHSNSTIKSLPSTTDDPRQRKPDITTAKREIGWAPRVGVEEGLRKAIEYFRQELSDTGEIVPTGPDASRPKPSGD